jgi:ribosomal protein S21
MALNYSVKVRRNDNIERVIKRFIKKTKKLGIIDEAKERRFYMKPSEKKRLARKRSDAKRKKEEAKRKN